MYDIAAIGEPVIDFEETGRAGRPEFRANAGGGSLNVLAAAAAQGGSTAMIGCVGNDIFGKYLISAIKAHRIDTSGVKLSDTRNTGIGFVSLSDMGERSFLFYRDNTSPVDFYLPEDDAVIESAKILHYTSVSLAGKPGRASTLRAAARAERLGKPLSFDANYRPAMWGSEEEARRVIGREASRAAVVKMDDREAAFITGESEIEKAAQRVIERGAQLVCITLGAEGSYYAFSGGAGYCGSLAVQAADTTGCGDAFMGTLLYGLLENRERLDVVSFTNEQMRRVVERANIAGALCSLKKGAVDCMPSREALDVAAYDFENKREMM